MYKKGKAWVFAGIVTATLALGVAGGQTAHADTIGDAASEQENASSQSTTPAKEVTLTQKSAANATDTTVSDAAKTGESSNADGQNTDTTKSSEEATASEGNTDTTKIGEPTTTDAKTTVTPTTPGKTATETVKAPATTTKSTDGKSSFSLEGLQYCS